jgi:hypothetical protein
MTLAVPVRDLNGCRVGMRAIVSAPLPLDQAVGWDYRGHIDREHA